MEEIAKQIGFTFSHTGCPCSGSPRIYLATHAGNSYRLLIRNRAGMWRLDRNGAELARGKADCMESKIKEIWDSSKN